MSPEQNAHCFSGLLGINEIFITDCLVTIEEQSTLVRWAEEKKKFGRLLVNPRDPEILMTPFLSADGGLTRFSKAGPVPDENGRPKKGFVWIPKISEKFMDPLPSEVWRIRTRVVDLLGLHGLEEDHYKGSFLSYIAPSGKVHEHRDARVNIEGEEFLILRCNVLFKKPRLGGMPVIGSKEIYINDRGMWAFFPTEFRHSTTTVRGSESRGCLSFGFLVRRTNLWQRRFRIVSDTKLRDQVDSQHRFLQDAADGQRVSSLLRERQSTVWRFIASQNDEFSVNEVAQALGQDPLDIWETLRDFQALRLIKSISSERATEGKILLFQEVLICVSEGPRTCRE